MEKSAIERLAQVGLAAKGIVYLLLGTLAFMAAFNLGNAVAKEATQSNVFLELKEKTGGVILLAALIAGLACYCIWRFVQSITATDEKLPKRLRYFLSGIVYSSLAYSAVRLLLYNEQSGNQQQALTASFLAKPYGEAAIIAFALILAGVGVYQIWYALSEKYKKHAQQLNRSEQKAQLLLASGKAGYLARGAVWLIIAYLFIKAALLHDASQAGNTGKAFQFLKESPVGSYLLAAVGLGLITYGVFNFVRARYENLS